MSGSSTSPGEELHNAPRIDDGRSQLPPSYDETRDSSLPIPHSPPQAGPLTVAEARATNPTLVHPRPLPSLPAAPPVLQYPQEAEDARAVDDGDPADLPPQPFSSARTRRPRGSLDEGDRTSSGFSDSELLYASAPSSPLRVSTEYGSSENDDGTPFRIGVVRHEVLERHAAVALSAFNSRPSGRSRLSTTTMDSSNDGASTRQPTATQMHNSPLLSATSEASPVSIGLSEGHKTYVRHMLALSGDEPNFPIPDVHPNSSVSHDNQNLPPISGSRDGTGDAPVVGPSAPLQSPGNSGSSAETPISLLMPEPEVPSLIPGTGLLFEPLHRLKSASFPSPSKYSVISGDKSSYFNKLKPLPSYPPPYSTTRYGQGFRAGGVGSSGFPKLPRYLSYPSIPPGAAAPRPPGSLSSTDLPIRRSQDSGANLSRLASPSPPSDKDKEAVHLPDSNNVHATISKFNSDTNIAAKLESRFITPSRDNKQTAPAPEVSLRQPRHVLGENISATHVGGTARDHQKVSGSNDSNAPPIIIVGSDEVEEDDSRASIGRKQLVRDDSSTQTTRIQSSSPATRRSIKSGSPEHRISSQSKFNNFESSSPPKFSSPPRSSATTAPSTRSLSEATHTLTEKKSQYNKIPASSRSQYINMLLALDDIPMMYNLAASFFTWILLAGFVLFPGTFTSLQTLDLGDGFEASLVNGIVNLPVFIVAFICTGVGIIGMIYLWWKWMKNYIWLVNKIFLPGFMNSLAGVISTIVNVYGVQHGEFNTTSIITISVTGGTGLVLGILSLWYGVFLLGLIKKRHAREMGIEKAGKHGEGVYAGEVETQEKEK